MYCAAGLFVNIEYVHLGSSPDGMFAYDCFGEGLIEIKCLYKHRTVHPLSVTNDKDFACKLMSKERNVFVT